MRSKTFKKKETVGLNDTLAIVFHIHYGQEDREITITFDGTPLKEALLQLENKIPYTFFFQETWFKEHRVSHRFVDKKIRAILNVLLEGTTLNYFIKGDRIILLNNSVVNP